MTEPMGLGPLPTEMPGLIQDRLKVVEAELTRLRDLAAHQEAEISVTLATALYGNPDAAGEHTADTLAVEAAGTIARQRSLLRALAVDLRRWYAQGNLPDTRLWANRIDGELGGPTS